MLWEQLGAHPAREMDRAFNECLAAQIRDYWWGRGLEVRPRVEIVKVGRGNFHTTAIHTVRSDMVNGHPTMEKN